MQFRLGGVEKNADGDLGGPRAPGRVEGNLQKKALPRKAARREIPYRPGLAAALLEATACQDQEAGEGGQRPAEADVRYRCGDRGLLLPVASDCRGGGEARRAPVEDVSRGW